MVESEGKTLAPPGDEYSLSQAERELMNIIPFEDDLFQRSSVNRVACDVTKRVDILPAIIEEEENDCSLISPCVRNVKLSKLTKIPILCDGVKITAILDSGAEVTCVNSNKLNVVPGHSLETITL